MEGIPSSVCMVPGQNGDGHPAHAHGVGGSSDSTAGAVHSRARARRNDERYPTYEKLSEVADLRPGYCIVCCDPSSTQKKPAPFLCVDNLPVDRVIIDGRSSAHEAPRRTMTTHYREVTNAMPSSAPVKKSSGGVQAQAPSRVISRSSVRNASSAASYNYNSFFTHKNPAFLSGPPTLWSMNNRFWPHATPPSEKPKLPPLPSALNLEIASQRPKNAQPFKHGSQPEASQDRPVSPSFEMKVQTVNAIRNVSRKLSKQSAPSTAANDPSGRLLKGRLKPLQTFKVEGPPINKCQGIQPGAGKSYTPSQSRLLQRKRELLNMLPPDVFQTRPQTEESVHRTSIASTWDETGGKDYEDELQPKDPLDVQDPASSNSKLCYQPPNSPTEQLGDPSAIRDAQDKNDQNPSFQPDTLTEGGASQILCKMISRVKTSPVKGDSATPDEADAQLTKGSITTGAAGRELLGTRSEPDLMTSTEMNLLDDDFVVNRQGSEGQIGMGDTRIGSPQGSEMFDVVIAERVDARQEEETVGLGSSSGELERVRLVLKSGSNHRGGEVLETLSGTFQVEEGGNFDVNGNLQAEHVEHQQRTKKFFISESPNSDVSHNSGVLNRDICGTGTVFDSSKDGGHPIESMESDVHAGLAQVSRRDKRAADSREEAVPNQISPCTNSDEGDDVATVERLCTESLNPEGIAKPNSSENDIAPNCHHDNKLDGCRGDQAIGHHHGDQPDGELAGPFVMGDDGCCTDGKSEKTDDQASRTVKPGAPDGSCKDDVEDIGRHGDRKDDDEEGNGTSGSGGQGGCSDAPEECTSQIGQNRNENMNNSNYGSHSDQNRDYLEDIPDIDESVLFCAYCDLDIDDCRCYFMRDPALRAYQGILTEGVAVLQTEEEMRPADPERVTLKGRPHSAPCSLTEGMTVIRGSRLAVKGGHGDHKGRQTEEGESQEAQHNERSLTEEMSVVVTPLKPRNSKSVTASPPPPLNFKITGRPPDGMVYYFGYGAEMNSDRLMGYLGDGEVGERLWGVLYGFTLRFNRRGAELSAGGFPNISYDPASSVEGCVYCLTLDQLQKLDCMIGCPEFQIKVVLPVWMINCCDPSDLGVAQCCIPAVIHIARDAWTHDGPLCNSYSLQQCMLGGDLLTPAYRSHLQSLMCACCR